MLGLALRSDHSSGSFRLEVWRDEHGELSLCVYDAQGGPQFDFELSEGEAKDFIFLIERAMSEKPGERIGE